MNKDIFDFTSILGKEASEEDKKNISKDVDNFFGEGDNFSEFETSVRQGDVSKVQKVEDVTKNKGEDFDDVSLFFDKDSKEKPEEETSEKESAVNESSSGEEILEENNLEKPSSEKQEEDNAISYFVKALKENDILDEEVDNVKDFESLKEVIKNLGDKNSLKDLNEDQKNYLESLKNGLTHEAVVQHNNIMAQLNNVNEKDLEDETLARQVYETYLKQKGFSNSKIERTLSRTIKDDSLFEESKEALEELKTLEKERFEQEQDSLKKERQKEFEKQKKIQEETESFLTSEKNEVIPGLKITKKESKEIISDMNSFKYEDPDTKRKLNSFQKFIKENPSEYRAISYYLFKKGFFTGKADLSAISKKEETKAALKFEKYLKEEKNLSGGKHKEINEYDETDQILDAI